MFINAITMNILIFVVLFVFLIGFISLHLVMINISSLYDILLFKIITLNFEGEGEGLLIMVDALIRSKP